MTDNISFRSLYWNPKYDRRTDISFYHSYWDLCHTDEQTSIQFTLKLKSTQDRQMHKLRFILSLILKSTYERRTDISFHHLYWNRRKTDKLHFISFHPLCWHLRQTDKILFISLLILGLTDKRFISPLIYAIQNNNRIKTNEHYRIKTFFHSSYWNLHKTNVSLVAWLY